MLLSSNISNDGKTLTITVSGNFNVDLVVEFKKAYMEVPNKVCNYIIDLGNVYLIDPSTMVMILIMREEKGKSSANISLVNCNKDIVRMLEIYGLHKLINVRSIDEVDTGFEPEVIDHAAAIKAETA